MACIERMTRKQRQNKNFGKNLESTSIHGISEKVYHTACTMYSRMDLGKWDTAALQPPALKRIDR